MICSSSQYTHVLCFGFGISVFGLTDIFFHEKLDQNLFKWFMYSKFILYTCLLNFLDKLILICLFMRFGVLVFLTKHILVIKDKNNDMYMFHVCWTYVHMQHASKCLSIMFLYLDKVWTKFI